MGLLRKLLLACSLLPLAAVGQEGGDVQAQILYAFHAEDSNTLASLVQTLATRLKDDAGDRALRYHLAHARYRFGELLQRRQPKDAQASLSGCIDDLKPLLDQDVKSVESYILQAACYDELANLTLLQAVLLRSRASDRLQTAGRLAPRNPRYVLILAQQELSHAKPDSAERRHAVSQLKLAAQLFEQSAATSLEEPGWGHAQAYLLLGSELKSRGEKLEARNWIEKALIVAPDYKAAQRELARP